jgi:hypothetical protein
LKFRLRALEAVKEEPEGGTAVKGQLPSEGGVNSVKIGDSATKNRKPAVLPLKKTVFRGVSDTKPEVRRLSGVPETGAEKPKVSKISGSEKF